MARRLRHATRGAAPGGVHTEGDARIGGIGGSVRAVTLDVTHPSWDVADYNYHLDFAWKLD